MSTMAKNAPPSEVTDGLESHLRHSSLISAAAFADADALIITPAAAPAAVLAASIASPVSAHLFSHLRNYSMNSYPSRIYEFIPPLNI
jgi:hypothetical protein